MKRLDGPRRHLLRRIDEMREYERITDFSKIARRALANNSFDGVLTMVGTLTGNYLAEIESPGIVIQIGIGASVAIGVSGFVGRYLAESAERSRELAELERISLIDLGRTKIGRAARAAVVVVSLIDGLAPLVSSLIVLIPFFIAPLIGNILISYVLSFIVAMVTLFGLGTYLGRISQRSLVGYGLRTTLAGVAAIVINFLLPTRP